MACVACGRPATRGCPVAPVSTAGPSAPGLSGGVWRNSAFRRIWVGQVVSEVGDWAARLAMSILVFAATGSALQSALVFSVSLLPALGPGQWLTVRTGRLPRRTVFLVTESTRAALLVLLARVPGDRPGDGGRVRHRPGPGAVHGATLGDDPRDRGTGPGGVRDEGPPGHPEPDHPRRVRRRWGPGGPVHGVRGAAVRRGHVRHLRGAAGQHHPPGQPHPRHQGHRPEPARRVGRAADPARGDRGRGPVHDRPRGRGGDRIPSRPAGQHPAR